VDFSIEYSSLPEDVVLLKEPPKYLKIKVQGTGFTLLRYAWFSYKDLDIDLQNLQTNPAGRSYWTSSSALDYLQAQLNEENTKIIDVQPDTLFFEISRLSSRYLPIELNYRPGFDTTAYIQYGAADLSFDSVLVKAPLEVFSSLDRIETQMAEIENPKDSLELTLSLEKPDFPHLELSETEVLTKLQFSALTEDVLQVPIQTINVPDSVKMELFPSQVELTFRCAMRDFRSIRAEEFIIYADYQSLANAAENRYISLSIENPPSQVLSVGLNPKRVEFLLSKP